MSYIIGMDIGTSSVKAVLINEKNEIIKTAHGAFEYNKSENGIVEISAEMFIKVCTKVIKELASLVGGDIFSICASSASGNLLLLDKELNPSTPIINWQDKRVKNEAIEILGELDKDSFYRQTGWPFSYKAFPLAQMCYIKKHNNEIIDNAGKVCMSTEYLYYIMTGKWGISTSSGTPFFFIDQQSKSYIPKLLEKFSLSENQFPNIYDTGTVLGKVTKEAAEMMCLNEETSVVLGTFDHPSAARGAGITTEGQVLLSLGTSWVAFFPIEDREKIADAGMLIDPFLSDEGGCWAGMASVSSVSERIWLYVSKYIDDGKDAFSILSALAEKSETGAGGLIINPKDDPSDKDILKYPKHHIARAIMEGSVRLLKDKLDNLKEKGIAASEGFVVGGPSESPFLIKLIEEMCDINLKVVHGKYTGAMGAAVIARYATKTF